MGLTSMGRGMRFVVQWAIDRFIVIGKAGKGICSYDTGTIFNLVRQVLKTARTRCPSQGCFGAAGSPPPFGFFGNFGLLGGGDGWFGSMGLFAGAFLPCFDSAFLLVISSTSFK